MTPIEQVRESVTHELKCHPEPFQAVKRNEKNFEFRRDDRDYRVGDELHLLEWLPGDTEHFVSAGAIVRREIGYTGDECHRRVDYIIREGFGIPEGYCIMSISLLSSMEGQTKPSVPCISVEDAMEAFKEWCKNDMKNSPVEDGFESEWKFPDLRERLTKAAK